MNLYYNLLLFAVTLLGGSIVLWSNWLNDKRMHLFLAFSGSFLLSVTFLHLLPETFAHTGGYTGLYLLIGFFLQLVIQRFTHGLEHGHVHVQHTPGEAGSHSHQIPLITILSGLAIHALMEGLPLGFRYHSDTTEHSLYFAVMLHKLPEAMLATSLIASIKGKRKALVGLCFFSLLSPLSAILAHQLGDAYTAVQNVVAVLIPIVAGAFIHIATTIFFESGTRQHMLTYQKIFGMLLGVALAMLTLLGDTHSHI